jgi:VWFA-related protein
MAGVAAAADDPLLWPEPQRAFLQDGPGLLLSEEQRAAFAGLDAAGRERFIEDFFRDPLPETPANELREGIERRSRAAAREFSSPRDTRWQLAFLAGPPAARQVIDCAAAFRPMEIWTYAEGAAAREMILYQPTSGEPFRLWLPIDSKRALYTSEMEYWLDQWVAIKAKGKRIDHRFCPDAEKVDRITGVDGLQAIPVMYKSRDFRWVPPQDRAALLAAPAELATWAREAAATPLPPEPSPLEVGSVDLDFPRRQGQRLVARALLSLPSAAGMQVQEENGKPHVRLLVEGVLEYDGRVFEELRVRYQVAPPAEGAPAALLLEAPLRPGQSFLLRAKITDEASGAQARVTRGFLIPDKPVSLLPAAVTAIASQGERARAQRVTGPDTLLLLPPPEDVVLGVWRAETVVTGGRITRAVFLVDGEPQLSRTRPPFSAELRLADFPREQVVRVEGYDEAGELVAADQVVLNQARGGFRVLITDPPRGSRTSGTIQARAEVVVPEERTLEAVEFRVNDVTVATLTSPPWRHAIEVPAGGDIAFLSVVARLDDGTQAEELRFLRAPANLEEVEVNVVELFATVLDSSGHPQSGLTAADFELLEGGKRQEIARFERVENLPLHLGIVIDTSFSMASSLTEAQSAAAGFLQNLITPKDRCFALGFANRPELLMPPVDDVAAVALSLEGLRAFGRTALHDAVITGLYYFRGQRSQRALVLLTDGDDTGSSTSWEDVLAYARRSGAAIYTIGLGVSGLDRTARGKLSELAEVSGGRSFFIGRAEELSGVYDQIEDELRSRYFLAYNSGRPAEENGFRPIEVKVKRGLRVRTSRAYAP